MSITPILLFIAILILAYGILSGPKKIAIVKITGSKKHDDGEAHLYFVDSTGREGAAGCYQSEIDAHPEGSDIVVTWTHSPLLGPTDTKLSEIRANEAAKDHEGYTQETPERGNAWLAKQVLGGIIGAGLMAWCFYAFNADLSASVSGGPEQLKPSTTHQPIVNSTGPEGQKSPTSVDTSPVGPQEKPAAN